MPDVIAKNASLIVDIKTPDKMSGSVDAMVEKLLDEGMSYNPAMLMDKLKYPVMTPIIPRPEGFYTSYLGSRVINNDFNLLHGNIPKSDEDRFKNIDMQVYYMIKEANYLLELNEKTIINGYSAGAICYKLNENKELLPFYPEFYTKKEINIIHNLYGHNNIERFIKNQSIYRTLGINSLHKIYSGNHITLFRLNREELINDMIDIIKLAKEENF